MLTLFIPKAFPGQIGIIQRNAIESWKHLQLRPEILLLETTLLFSDLFRHSAATATSPCLCYFNADFIVLGNFLRAAVTVQRTFPKSLLVSGSTNQQLRNWENLCAPSPKR